MAPGRGREANYWPGFVDALTNTVIAMVFVVIVLTLSLSVFINAVANQRAAKIVSSKADEAKNAAPVVLPDTPAPPRVSVSTAGEPPNSRIPAPVLKGELRVATDEKKQSQGMQTRTENAPNALTLYFPGTTVEVDSKTAAELDRIVANSGLAFSQLHATIVARGPQIFLSENQRLAFFRAMAVRNFLIKKDMPRDNITIRIEDAPGTTEGMVVVSVGKAGAR